jgi:hypothetical protein
VNVAKGTIGSDINEEITHEILTLVDRRYDNETRTSFFERNPTVVVSNPVLY